VTVAKAASSPEALLGAHRARIERHIRRLVRDRGDAEDLTQETLLRAQQQLGALKDRRALGAWLRRIATNVCTDHLRESARRGRLADGGRDGDLGLGAPSGGAAHPSLEELVDRARMNACGETFLKRLPAAHREVLVLHDLRGLTSAEIARRLGCTVGAVKIRLHRARRQFRAALEEGCEFYRDAGGALVGAPKAPRR
jgi:RNA polymerase sigma-70 factor (ECF subfamily)